MVVVGWGGGVKELSLFKVGREEAENLLKDTASNSPPDSQWYLSRVKNDKVISRRRNEGALDTETETENEMKKETETETKTKTKTEIETKTGTETETETEIETETKTETETEIETETETDRQTDRQTMGNGERVTKISNCYRCVDIVCGLWLCSPEMLTFFFTSF